MIIISVIHLAQAASTGHVQVATPSAAARANYVAEAAPLPAEELRSNDVVALVKPLSRRYGVVRSDAKSKARWGFIVDSVQVVGRLPSGLPRRLDVVAPRGAAPAAGGGRVSGGVLVVAPQVEPQLDTKGTYLLLARRSSGGRLEFDAPSRSMGLGAQTGSFPCQGTSEVSGFLLVRCGAANVSERGGAAERFVRTLVAGLSSDDGESARQSALVLSSLTTSDPAWTPWFQSEFRPAILKAARSRTGLAQVLLFALWDQYRKSDDVWDGAERLQAISDVEKGGHRFDDAERRLASRMEVGCRNVGVGDAIRVVALAKEDFFRRAAFAAAPKPVDQGEYDALLRFADDHDAQILTLLATDLAGWYRRPDLAPATLAGGGLLSPSALRGLVNRWKGASLKDLQTEHAEGR